MTDRPVLFSAPMVRALIEGKKTQTRRLAWSKNETCPIPTIWQKVKPGDRLWVRETWAECNGPPRSAVYRANLQNAHEWRWTPSIHMPRWASRITLVVTEARVERLQEISHDDAVAEGMGIFPQSMSAEKRFSEIWESLHGQGSWEANPEVAALTFTVHHCTIDQREDAA